MRVNRKNATGHTLRLAKDLGGMRGEDRGHRFGRQRWSRLPQGPVDLAQHWVLICKKCARGVELVPVRVDGHVRWVRTGPAILTDCDVEAT